MKGKVAIITASSTGIGKGIAENLAKEGVTVIISSRSKDNIDQTVNDLTKKGYSAYGIICDVGKSEDRSRLIQQTISKYGKINYLVCNAAVATKMGRFLQTKDDQLTNVWNINFKSTFFLIQEALPHLKKQKENSIVIVSSYAAYDLPPLIGHYAITKTALVALTKILAKQLLQDEIRVNCVCPGIIKTSFSEVLWVKDQQKSAQNFGVKRLGVPEDIAKVVRFLLSSEAKYMTGQSIIVAGRQNARL